jgi:hypothetical protein
VRGLVRAFLETITNQATDRCFSAAGHRTSALIELGRYWAGEGFLKSGDESPHSKSLLGWPRDGVVVLRIPFSVALILLVFIRVHSWWI